MKMITRELFSRKIDYQKADVDRILLVDFAVTVCWSLFASNFFETCEVKPRLVSHIQLTDVRTDDIGGNITIK